MANLRFVITGGPGAGKTTTLEALAERGYHYVPEAARTLIGQRLEAGLGPRPLPNGRDWYNDVHHIRYRP